MRSPLSTSDRWIVILLITSWALWLTASAGVAACITTSDGCKSQFYPNPCPGQAYCTPVSSLLLSGGISIPACAGGPSGQAGYYKEAYLVATWSICQVPWFFSGTACGETPTACTKVSFYIDDNCSLQCSPTFQLQRKVCKQVTGGATPCR